MSTFASTVPASRTAAVAAPQTGAASRRAPRTVAALLLAASVAALAVVADQLVGPWADDHLLSAWIAMWAVVFAGSLFLADPIRRLAQRVMAGLDGWAQRRALARADARFMAMAGSDSRLATDLRCAQDRDEDVSTVTRAPAPAAADWRKSPMESIDVGHGRRVPLYYI